MQANIIMLVVVLILQFVTISVLMSFWNSTEKKWVCTENGCEYDIRGGEYTSKKQCQEVCEKEEEKEEVKESIYT